jgi:hypothetical protein
MNIQKECMILSLQVGTWLGYRLDKEVTRKVTTDASASPDAVRVNKHLVAKEQVSDFICADKAIRSHFYANTLPWKDNGDRLLTRRRYMSFMPEHRKLVEDFESAVEQFLTVKYAIAMDQAAFRMGELFKADDYPSVTELRRKFYVNLDIDGVSTAYDYRLETNDAAIQARVTKAMTGLWEKLQEPLKHFTDKMASDEIFRDSTIGNLRQIVRTIPELNFLDDPNLEQVRLDIEAKLLGFDAADLRKDKDASAAVAGEAADIMRTMQGFMKALGGNSE